MKEQLLVAKFKADSLPERTYVTGVINNKEDFILYPNPANENVKLLLPEANGNIEVRDILGKLLILQKVTAVNEYIDIRELCPGTYFAIWANNKSRVLKKLVVQ